MKKFKLLILLVLSMLMLTACSTDDQVQSLNTINIPESDIAIRGIWEKVYEYNISEATEVELANEQEMFISRKVIEYEDSFILNPNITTRYVNFNSYITSKISTIPEFLKLEEDNVLVYKFTNNVSTSFEFMEISEGYLVTIYLGNVSIYQKTSEVSDQTIDSRFNEVNQLVNSNDGVEDRTFGLAIAFRVRDTSVSSFVKHNYFTYYIKKDSDSLVPNILKVRNIVVPKTTGLWTIAQDEVENAESGLVNYRLGANPTFINEELKTNNMLDNFYRRIDYVNLDYIATTNFNYNSKSVAESYSIFNLHEIANKTPLSISEIGGEAGNEIYQTTFKENYNSILSSEEISGLDLLPNPNNIGIQRIDNGWKFISGIDQEINSMLGSRIYRKFDLNISPIINIGRTENTSITWREVQTYKRDAIDATISPNSDFVLIQTSDAFEIYPIIFNYIGNSPLFTIHNVDNYEIVMAQWMSNDNINNYYQEYLKLPQQNNYIIYP